MTIDFRAMCAELAEALHEHTCLYEGHESELVTRARALLAQPEPEGLTDKELLRTYGKAKRDHCYEGDADDWPKKSERAATVAGLRAAIAANALPTEATND